MILILLVIHSHIPRHMIIHSPRPVLAPGVPAKPPKPGAAPRPVEALSRSHQGGKERGALVKGKG